MKRKYLTTLASVALVQAMAAYADREWPEQTYRCQVVTNTGKTGLVDIRSYSLDRVKEIIVGQPALTYDGNYDATEKIVQCLGKFSNERFFDVRFQAFLDSLSE